jgi:hypothetical protein
MMTSNFEHVPFYGELISTGHLPYHAVIEEAESREKLKNTPVGAIVFSGLKLKCKVLHSNIYRRSQ